MRSDAGALPVPGRRGDVDDARPPAAQHGQFVTGGAMGQRRTLPHRQLCRPEHAVRRQRPQPVHAVVHPGRPAVRAEAVDPVVVHSERQELPA
jgi:hypothetical protein